VVASDRYVAEDALDVIQVEYEPLDPVLDPRLAARDECSLVSERRFCYGEVEAAFDRADVRVGGEFAFPAWTGLPIEGYVVVADWEPGSDRLTAWANFQGPFTLHAVTASALGLTGSRFRLIIPSTAVGALASSRACSCTWR
jgi:2-furoyl-CoA dehydrogenase large subunit